MGSKYAKLFCAMIGLIVLSLFQYHELEEYYTENLPYEAVKKFVKEHPEENQSGELTPEELVGSSTTARIPSATERKRSYSSNELEILAANENEECAESSQEVSEAMGQEVEQLVDETTKSSSDLFKLNAVGAVLMDADSLRVLYGKNEDKVLAMASTTKIMTCIVALEQGNLDEIVTVSQRAAKMPDVQLNMIAGEQYYLLDLLYSLMLESHNDSAVAIAEHIGGSVEGFAELMNQKAKELGCSHTNFVTPNGLDAEGHSTTARELATIAAYAIQNPKFIEITNTPAHEFKELTKEKIRNVTNKNRFLYMMDGAIGVKTGFTNNAGYCFVGAVKREDRTLISVVLGSGWPPHKTYKWNDTMRLMDYGVSNYSKRVLMNQKIALPDVYIMNGQESFVKVYAQGMYSALLKKEEVVRAEYVIRSVLQAPVSEGTVVGELYLYIDDSLFQSIPVYVQQEVKEMHFDFCLRKACEGFLWMKH